MIRQIEHKLGLEKEAILNQAEAERKRIEDAKNIAEDQKQKLLKKLKQKEE